MEKRFEALDSWRGIAAVMVMLFHFNIACNWSFNDSPFVLHADLLVTFFFVLSGFVISHAYERRLNGSVVPFMLRRFGRLYPLHLATLGLMLAWAMARPVFENGPVFDGGIYDWSAIFTNLLLLQGIGFEDHFTWNYPSWSISAEFYTYVIFALVWAALGARALLGVAALLVATIAFNATTSLPNISVLMLTNCVAGFATGVLVQNTYRATSRIGLSTSPALATSIEIAAVGVVLATLVVDGFPNYLIPLAYAPVIYVFAFEGGLISQLLRTGLPRMLGRLSYSIYMTHAVVVMAVGTILTWAGQQFAPALLSPSAPGGTQPLGSDVVIGNLLIAGLVALTLLASMATYRLVEVPGRHWGGRLADKWRRRTSSTAPAAR